MRSLKDCNSSAEVCAMEFDNADVDGFAIYNDGTHITIVCRDGPGEVVIPKKTFDRLLAVYEQPQTTTD